MDLEATIPRIDDLAADPDELAEVIGEDGELVLIHNGRDLQVNDRTIEDARFVSCCMVIDQPKDATREFVTDFENYESLIDYIHESTVLGSDEASPSARFNVGINTPFIEPRFSYTAEYDLTGEDVWFQSTDGDFDLVLGRWEFIELSEDRTLLVYTSWFEFGSLSWTLRTIFWAQPDLELVIPVTQAAVLCHAMKKKLEDRSEEPPGDDASVLPDSPDIPLFTESDEYLDSITPLAEMGTLMKIHPEQWINDHGQPLNVRFVSGIGLMEVSRDRARDHATDFERYVDYIQQVSRVKTDRAEDGELMAEWILDLGINILSIGVSYTIKYSNLTDRAMTFHCVGGDLEHVYGALEWEGVGEDRTLFFYTTATQIGSGDSMIVKIANVLPFKQLVIGVSAGAMAVEKLVRSINRTR